MTDGRRWSDDELKDLAALVRRELPPVYEFANGNRRRVIINWAAIAGIATILGIVQSYLLQPIETKAAHTDAIVQQLSLDVRKHHEESAFVYVTQAQYARDQENLMREIRALRDLIIVAERQEVRR